jgi:transposase
MDSSLDCVGITSARVVGNIGVVSRKEESAAENTTVAVDLAKSVFEIAVSPRPGRVSERHRLSRTALLRFFAERPAATVVMEACGSAHFWARGLERLGHSVVLLPPQHVRRYRPRNKTDRADAKALLEAFRNEDIRQVPVKSVAQQERAALHRLREAWMGSRTARINTLRGLLRESRAS